MLATVLVPRQEVYYNESHDGGDHLDAYAKLIGQLHFYVVACLAVFIWDTLVTLKQEVIYVWPSRFTLVKVCYFVNRYLTLIIMCFLVACSFSTNLLEHCDKAYLPIVVFLCCNYKLIQRASSLFHDPRIVFYSLLAVVLAQAAVQAVVSLKNHPIPMPPGVTGCYSFPLGEYHNYAFIYWVLPLFTQTIVLLITLGKVIQYWTMHGRSHLLDIFLKDGVHFFAVTASSNIVNVVYMKSKISVDGHQLSGANFNSALALIINSMMVSRLIIHMRIALADHSTITCHTEDETKTISSGKFEGLRGKLGLPSITGSKYSRNRRKNHHNEHGVTTIVDLPALERAANTFTPAVPGARTSLSYESQYGRRNSRRNGPSSASSSEDISMKEILEEMPIVPQPAAARAISFNLPEGHALSHPSSTPSSLKPITRITRGDLAVPEMLRLNRRPLTTSASTTGGRVKRTDAPVLFVGEAYHHRSDVAVPSTAINLKNAITVTTEQVVKAEGGEKD
ncbi:hypothetical protein P389DRAFT_209114 [Cystobasidium minutum MCA 4210]|uniref:uncharacterized protein n=1 Tax=Cystobasidium minutum MCA 4210 TaxID=1397322 RepID=UPI0034CE56C6|eukprot:jgi/Rhomi1/209114/estExt_Genemark1.C_2_t20418